MCFLCGARGRSALGATVTVRDILKSPKLYHKKTCADPLEPEYGGGKNLAKIYTLDGLPQIFSHAHGGIRYLLKPDLDAFFEAVDAPPPLAAAAGEWAEPIDLFGDGDRESIDGHAGWRIARQH